MAEGFGAFGKMPGLGDFFRLDLPNDFVEPWDQWLQQVLVAGRAALGGGWQQSYMSAPIWRFALSPGQMGERGVLGILMPSVDRVGRQFPLTLAAFLPGGTAALDAHFANIPTFAQLEAVALDALENDLSREALVERLSGLRLHPAAPLTESVSDTGVLRAAGADVMPSLLAALIAPGFRRPSIWSAELEEDGRVWVTEGMPAQRDWPGFFDLRPTGDDSLAAVLA